MLPGSGAAAPAIVVTGPVGAGLAVLVHEAALLAAACVVRVRFRPVWPGAASAVSVALLPFGVAEGPFPGHEALPATPFRHARWVYLAGIAANLAAAGLLCGLYLGQPLPALRLFAELQLGAAAFASLPLRPMDGAPFRNHPRDSLLLLPLALLAALGGFAFHARLL